ncbi:MAG: tRNA uridine-5-carboxymethylaminomethyl(34) synthesis GTPase MnmE [Pseudomonadota bacterium]
MMDTIVAIASGPGRGGVGVVRLSGPDAIAIAAAIAGAAPREPRTAVYRPFRAPDGELIDLGLVIEFPAPASFTGEDVVELQGHGAPVALQALVAAAVAAGAREARPGEFSERAFLNGKLDLVQAEAIADLVAASTLTSARAALRSLAGEFSDRVSDLMRDLVGLRVQVEAAIDFPDEDIEILGAPAVTEALAGLLAATGDLLDRARAGVIVGQGARVALVGAPNVGKSTLLNRLCGESRAIVTATAGTTRDLLREQVDLAGLAVEFVDTAGLRVTDDPIEREGMRRAWDAAQGANLVLALATNAAEAAELTRIFAQLDKTERPFGIISRSQAETERTFGKGSQPASSPAPPWLWVQNKCDTSLPALGEQWLPISALQGSGVDALRAAIRSTLTAGAAGDDAFAARERHVRAIERARAYLDAARRDLESGQGAELVAEQLRLGQEALGSVCGDISADDLLGEIFSSFCIGK